MGFHKRKVLRVSKGQISPELIERTDIGILDTSGQEITNWHNSKYGSLKTELPTVLKYTFGTNKKLKLVVIKLQDNSEGFIAFNATDHTIAVFDSKANLLSNIYNFPQITEANYKHIKIAQNQDLILLCTGDNPIIQINLTLPNISASVFSIPASKILKSSNISEPVLSPVLYRMGTAGLPSDPKSMGMKIGDYSFPNSGTQNPNASFPWNVKKLVTIADSSKWTVTAAKINNAGTGYQVGDVVLTGDGASFTVTDASAGASLTINEPSREYNSDPTNTGVAVTGGSGSGMTIDLTGTTIQTVWEDAQFTPNELDVIKDTWQDKYWQWTNGTWIVPNLSTTDKHYGTQWTINAGTGVVKVTGTGTLLTITAPTGVNPQKYAEATLIGVDFDGEDAIGIMRITGLTGTTSGQNYNITAMTGTTLINFDSTGTKTGFTIKYSQVKVFDGDYPNTENNPTSSTNYPKIILFYQQRLIIAGTTYNRSQMIFSELGVYNSFTDENLSDSAFQLVIGSTEKEEILSVLLNQGIQIFTNSNEWLMNDTVITRSSGFVRNSSIGTNGVQPIIAANGVTLFPPKNGKGIIGFVYSYETASFMTPYITLFTNLLDDPIEDMMLKRGLDSQDDTLIYICDDQGEMVIGNYLKEHEIQAFTARKSGTCKFKQAIQCEMRVIFLTERNGVTSIELVDENKKTAAVLSSINYNPVTGILAVPYPQYTGQELNIYDGKGEFVGNYKVINNSVTIPAAEKPLTISEAGINIHSTFGSNPLNVGNETKALYKTINSIMIAVTPDSKTDFLKVNGKFGRRIGDLVVFTRPARPLRDCRFKIENDAYPVEILSIEIELEA